MTLHEPAEASATCASGPFTELGWNLCVLAGLLLLVRNAAEIALVELEPRRFLPSTLAAVWVISLARREIPSTRLWTGLVARFGLSAAMGFWLVGSQSGSGTNACAAALLGFTVALDALDAWIAFRNDRPHNTPADAQ